MIKIKRGLDLPISGQPLQQIEPARPCTCVALLGGDYHGLKPSMSVQVGERVKRGQVLFVDKSTPGVLFTAPAAGVVKAINRGAQRVLQSLVIELDAGVEEAVSFASYPREQLAELAAQAVRDNLLASGLWTALRTRPFSKVPAVDAVPSSIFVTAIDTQPLAADPQLIINQYADDFASGVQLLTRLAKVFLCKAAGTELPAEQLPGVQSAAFSGPHPAGLPGTHMHFLDPVS
ncbi:MAG: NADH:ubiquinone reductase (Na(+)-transporting) subunit A, partial [Pseudomonas sp.]|nr:NADH:ubiquinone reductase (Na(+)-transporting) subunit A [Pseudomonas sp.]